MFGGPDRLAEHRSVPNRNPHPRRASGHESGRLVEGSIDLDEVDRLILALIQDDPHVTNKDISERVDLARSSVHDRVKSLEASGLIEDYEARLDHEALGLAVTAFTLVSLKDYAAAGKIEQRLCRIEECLEVHLVTGVGDFLVKIRAESRKALHEVLDQKIRTLPGIHDLETMVALQSPKETIAIPVPEGEDAGDCN